MLSARSLYFSLMDSIVLTSCAMSVMFLLRGEPKVTLNCDMMTGDFYRSVYPETVVRGYHCPPIQQPYFNTISLDGSVPDDVLIEMIEHSYKVVVGKLPKKYQRELDSISFGNNN